MPVKSLTIITVPLENCKRFIDAVSGRCNLKDFGELNRSSLVFLLATIFSGRGIGLVRNRFPAEWNEP
jgi:hypothetical protein